ncbi:hypothetical protein iPHageKPN11i_00159 [Klebsiella phage iPHaGe-KPN-11i]|nr:hypothetical protein iPHageKPN12i_00141 [Klebsiella phage iPHaGe-KPN-12i]WOL25501.1 hypothetical protein iPHageKPN11i_00159 [Klebsiella phage iPHaGe-KPN-11i]
MLEREFTLLTTPEIRRYYLHNHITNEKHVVTMVDVEEAFKDNQLELTRVKNNKSTVWFLEEIFAS